MKASTHVKRRYVLELDDHEAHLIASELERCGSEGGLFHRIASYIRGVHIDAEYEVPSRSSKPRKPDGK